MLAKHTRGYSVSATVNSWHTLRFALMFILLLQMVSRIFLSMFYIPSAEHAFDSVVNIERNVHYG